MRSLLLLTLLTFFHLGIAQNQQAAYLEGKRLFGMGSYKESMVSFRELSDDQVFGPYATFYYALSAYNLGMNDQALNGWKQIRAKYPKWNQIDEVNFWLAKASIEGKMYLDGVNYGSQFKGGITSRFIESLSGDLNKDELKNIYDQNQKNRSLAFLYLSALQKEPFEDRDNETVQKLSKKFGFEFEDDVKDFPLVEKDKYAIALVLPFMFDSYENAQSAIRNTIIFDLYQGMLLAQDSLNSLGKPVKLYPYDTKKKKLNVDQLISSKTLSRADVIVGPLYQDPNKAMQAFSIESEIPVINPLSSNESIVKNNKYGYLFKPSYDTQGKIAAKYSAKSFTRNKKVMIFFEKEKDRIVAEAYKKVMDENGFNVVYFDELNDETALALKNEFTERYEYELDSLTKKQIDSIGDLPGRFIRSRVWRDKLTGKTVKNSKGEDIHKYYEMRLKVPKDTIGHIFLASSSNLLASKIISISELRGDDIAVVGYSDWLDFKLLSYKQLDRLKIFLIDANYFNNDTGEFGKTVRKRFYTEPSEYHFIGFELVMQLGNLLHENGKYFQRGLVEGEHIDGYLMEGIKYGNYNDNQVVPIVRLKDLKLEVQNYEHHED